MSQVEFDDKDEAEKGKTEDTEQFIAVEEDPDGVAQEEDTDKEEEDSGGKKEESRLGGGREEESDEDKKTRRSQEGKTRRQRQKDARERSDRELKFLRDRNETLERRFSTLEQSVDERITGNEINTLDTRISKAKSDLQLANQVMQQAIDGKEGADLVEAMGHRDTIRDNLRDLEQAKEYVSSQERMPRGRNERPLDARHVAHAQVFMVDHDWWDPEGRGADDMAVRRLDTQLVREGYDPATKEYWSELSARTKKELPHRFDTGMDETDDDNDDGETESLPKKKGRSKGPTFRTGGRERPLGKNEVFISAERKEAMIEAGVWDDPKLRNKFLKAYSTYDKEAQEQGA